jgi:hypothetical protein
VIQALRQQLIVEPLVEKQTLRLEVGDYIAIPDNCWAFDKETKQQLQVTEILASEAQTVVIVPKIAGG